MFFDWSKVKPGDMWQYGWRVKSLKERLDAWNREYSKTGVCPVNEREYMGTASELYYYWSNLPVFKLMDKDKLTKGPFFNEVK